MRTSLCLLVVSLILSAQPAPSPASEQHEFRLRNFKTEIGVTLPEALVVYGTYGHLNAAKDIAVLLPSY